MAYRLAIEGTSRFPILRAVPLDPPEQRSGHRGPFTDRGLMAELTAFARARCVAAGCSYPSLRGGSKNTWHFVTPVPRRDAQPLVQALTAYLADGDDQPLRRYMHSPPDLRARPGIGERW